MDDVVKGIGGEYTGNYTGPYWSNGKIQPSVEWGDQDPTSELDFLSRQHDSAYARFADEKHREAADRLYNEEAQKLAKKYPSIAGNLVLYGNYAKRSASNTASNFATGMRFGGLAGGLGGLIYTAAGNIVNANKMLNGTYLSKETEDVKNYFKTDPLGKTMPSSALKTVKALNGLMDSTRKAVRVLPNVAKAISKGGPTVKDIKKAELIASQAKKIENYQQLKNDAEKSNYIPIMGLAHRPQHLQQAYRKRKKKNKVHVLKL